MENGETRPFGLLERPFFDFLGSSGRNSQESVHCWLQRNTPTKAGTVSWNGQGHLSIDTGPPISALCFTTFSARAGRAHQLIDLIRLQVAAPSTKQSQPLVTKPGPTPKSNFSAFRIAVPASETRRPSPFMPTEQSSKLACCSHGSRGLTRADRTGLQYGGRQSSPSNSKSINTGFTGRPLQTTTTRHCHQPIFRSSVPLGKSLFVNHPPGHGTSSPVLPRGSLVFESRARQGE